MIQTSTVLRAWFYFRVGVSGYLSLLIGIIQFLFVATLYLQRIPAFADLHFAELAVLFLLPYSFLGIFVGYVHTKKQLNTDTVLATMQNPFIYKILPGKEARIGYPMMLLNLEVQRRFCEIENFMDENLSRQFDDMESLIRKLIAGESVK